MPEFFPPELPRGARPTRTYVSRLSRAAQQASATLDLTVPGAGTADLGADGPAFLETGPAWLFAEILDDGRFTEASGSGPSFGAAYKWEQRVPGPEGTWQVPNPAAAGDNGFESDDGLPHGAAYEANGNLFVPPGTVVQLWRGYLHGGADELTRGQEWVFWLGESPASGSNGPIWVVNVDNCDENGNIVRTQHTITFPAGTTVELTSGGP